MIKPPLGLGPYHPCPSPLPRSCPGRDPVVRTPNGSCLARPEAQTILNVLQVLYHLLDRLPADVLAVWDDEAASSVPPPQAQHPPYLMQYGEHARLYTCFCAAYPVQHITYTHNSLFTLLLRTLMQE